MSDAPYDLRDYVLDELTPVERAEVERYLATSTEAREEVERLRLTRSALLSLPEEEVPRRIAFISDKVFEPSPARRFWQGLWQGAPRLAFGMAALLLVLFGGAWATQPSVTSGPTGWRLAFGQPASVQPAAVQTATGLSEAQIRQVAEILHESEARQQEAFAQLVNSETARSTAETRAAIEQIRRDSDDFYSIQKAKWDQLYRDLAEPNRVAMLGR